MKAGQYIRRSVGYLIKLVALVAVLYLLMYVTGSTRVSADALLREMFSSQRGVLLAAALVVLAALYPYFGYVKRSLRADLGTNRSDIIEAMHKSGYILSPGSIDDSVRLVFRADSFFKRLLMSFEDAITVTAADDGSVTIEGPRKTVVPVQFRIDTSLNNF